MIPLVIPRGRVIRMGDQIHPDAVRAAADVVEQIEDLGFMPTMLHLEPSVGIEGHHILNVDAASPPDEPAEHPEALQRLLDPISSDHAAELAVAAPEAPMFPEEHGPRYWDLEAMIRISG